MPFYKDLISATFIIEGHVMNLGYAVSYIVVTMAVWIIIYILLKYSRLKRNKGETN